MTVTSVDELADENALLGTDSRLKLVEAVIPDILLYIEKLNGTVASAGERLCIVEENLKQQRQSELISPGSNAQRNRQFSAPTVEHTVLRLEDAQSLWRTLEEDRMAWKLNIVSLQRQLDKYEERQEVFAESQKVHQSVLDTCLQLFENCEDMRASIQTPTNANVEMRGHLRMVSRNMDDCLAKQRAVCEDQVEPTNANPIHGPKQASHVDTLPGGHIAKLLPDVASASERLTSPELCMHGRALDGQSGMSGQLPALPNVQASSVVNIDCLPETSSCVLTPPITRVIPEDPQQCPKCVGQQKVNVESHAPMLNEKGTQNTAALLKSMWETKKRYGDLGQPTENGTNTVIIPATGLTDIMTEVGIEDERPEEQHAQRVLEDCAQ
mmetsp:Transcript_104357/g.207239  ORF Transcript_104357/g.207239 Transcript_104357/m.207239 type:complete len:383 (-) Transcript_104357:123-1271(-)|eukprot:CAMPEP_0172923378 /NCGR_PEP_ID=MMETSP1075-20121228/209621_1 /TAXON_ID=2916 /ORGANISM="Ceratium fusus, Strain PA161109" /LENGTH=382 /DNA_ID=CAMNT_0013783843 /DNA_START=1 /DNA_END=1149 /DNA_ORIENTATION=+